MLMDKTNEKIVKGTFVFHAHTLSGVSVEINCMVFYGLTNYYYQMQYPFSYAECTSFNVMKGIGASGDTMASGVAMYKDGQTLEHCKLSCQSSSTCVGFEWWQDALLCYVFNSGYALLSDSTTSNVDTYLRFCDKGEHRKCMLHILVLL